MAGGGDNGDVFADLSYQVNYPLPPSETRDFNSNLGRWMSPDPGGVKVVNLDTPQTWNMCAYVADNPTTDTDPTGLSGQDNNSGGCAIRRNCTDDRQSLDHPPGQDPNIGGGKNQANQLTNKTQSQTGGAKYLQKTFEKIFGQKARRSDLPAQNGHDNEVMSTKYTSKVKNVFKSHAVITPRDTARFDLKINGKSYNLHVHYLGLDRGHRTVSYKVHFDDGNPSRDLFGAFKHFFVDMLWGKAEYPNSDGLDPQ